MTLAIDDDIPHGTTRGYRHRRCRCPDCTAANTRSCLEGYLSRLARTKANGGKAPIEAHNRATYDNWGCRCWTCSDNKSSHNANKKKKRSSS